MTERYPWVSSVYCLHTHNLLDITVIKLLLLLYKMLFSVSQMDANTEHAIYPACLIHKILDNLLWTMWGIILSLSVTTGLNLDSPFALNHGGKYRDSDWWKKLEIMANFNFLSEDFNIIW